MTPMVDLKVQYENLQPEIDEGLKQALRASKFILGPNVQEFEREAASYLGVKHAIGVGNGTDALLLALLAVGIKPGDEVITPAFTFIATAESISVIGAKPVFVDINPETFNLDVDLLEQALTPQTKAVLPVHLFGQPADMVAVKKFCAEHNLKLVEDCAQSFGASIGDQQTGSFGDAGCFSFFPSKNLGCYGDGGLVSCNDDDIAGKVRALRNHGSKKRYYHSMVGFNSRLDELQAVILRAKLPHIDEYNKQRLRVGHRYSDGLRNAVVKAPYEDGIGQHVYHQYTILSEHRAAIIEALNTADIANAIYYPLPLHRQQVYAEEYKNISLPVTEDICEKCLSLPIYPELEDNKIDKIIAVVNAV